MMKVKVTTMDTELEFASPSKSSGRDLFYQVTRNIGVREMWYFGLLHHDLEKNEIWIDTSRKSLKAMKASALQFKYRVKYYPEDVIQELIEDITIRYFFLQIRSSILSDKTYCPPETCVLLSSYAAQARHGDFDYKVHHNGVLSKEILLPERVYNQHTIKREVWEGNIVTMWKKHHGMIKEDAMLEYLKLAQNLEMYGVHYFDINNRKGTQLLLGVDALGLNIYKKSDRLNPIISFPWSEIHNINFRDTKFTIKPTDKKSSHFIFFSKDARINKRILSLGVGYHTLYIRRRQPETLEVMQMRAKAKEKKRVKSEQRARFLNEVLAREQAEKREQLHKEQIRAMREEMEKSHLNLLEAQKTIQKLKDQLRELQLSKEELEHQQRELYSMMKLLEENKNMEAAERRRLENDIYLKQLEVQKIQNDVEIKDRETQKLQEEVEAARLREEEFKIQQRAIEAEQKVQKLEEETITVPETTEVNEQLRDQLKTLHMELEKSRIESKDTELDKIHRDNIREGRNKYKTLNEIRKGNTVRRIDLFENL